MKNILIVINSLDIGGAEKFLYRLIHNLPEKKLKITLYPLKFTGSLIDSYNSLPIYIVDTRKYSIIKHLIELKKIFNNSSFVFSFLYQSDLIVIITKLIFRLKTIVIWNLRHSKTSFLGNKFSTYLNIKVNSLFSKYVDAITYNSEASFYAHKKVGFKFVQHFFLPNGFLNDSLNKFQLIDTTSSAIVIGNLSRFDFQKNHEFLLRSFSVFLKKTSFDVYLLLVGRNVLSKKMTKLISNLQLTHKVIRLNQITDTFIFFKMIDIYISTSRSESFSNSIAEAVYNDKKILISNVGDNLKYFDKLSIYENFDSNDFENKLNHLIENINKPTEYSLFKQKFSINNSVMVFLEIIDRVKSKY